MVHNKVILGLILVLVVIAGGLFFFSKKTETNNVGPGNDNVFPVVEIPNVHTVTYTEDGFSPQTLEMQNGGAVTFMNKSGSPMWVASAMHPTHAVYPQKSESDCFGSSFDACAPIAQDSSWNFTFTEVGSWGYHDHLKANNWGTIVVK